MGKKKRHLAMEALKKFDDEAGRVMVQIQRVQQKIETAQMKVASVIRKLLGAVDASRSVSLVGGAKYAKHGKKAQASECTTSNPTSIHTVFPNTSAQLVQEETAIPFAAASPSSATMQAPLRSLIPSSWQHHHRLPRSFGWQALR